MILSSMQAGLGISPENLPEVIRRNMTPHEENNVIDFKKSV